MREASLNRVINLEAESKSSARRNAEILAEKFSRFAEIYFNSIDELKLNIQRHDEDFFIISVDNEEFFGELKYEIANNIRFLNGKEEKFLSLNISGFCKSKDFSGAEEMNKSMRFWFRFFGFLIGTFIALAAAKITLKQEGIVVRPGWPYAYLIILAFGLGFAKIGNFIGDKIIKYQRRKLPENLLYQSSLKYWTDFINGINKILDDKYGEFNANLFVAAAKNNKNKSIDLFDFSFEQAGLDKYQTARNFSDILNSIKEYSEDNNPMSFLTIENKSSGNFLQFAKTDETNFLLNIPLGCLNETEKIRAEVFLRKITQKNGEKNIFDENRGFPPESDGQFELLLPNNPELAAKIVVGYFAEVYLLSHNFKYKITKENF